MTLHIYTLDPLPTDCPHGVHNHGRFMSDGTTTPHRWGCSRALKGGSRMNRVDDRLEAMHLRGCGIETLGDLGRLAEARGFDAALLLVREACRSAS